MRIGIIGCGTIGPTHAGALRQIEGVTLAAVADTDAERARGMAAKFSVTNIYESHAALLADPTLDAVTVCTPSGTHAEIGIAAMRAGKHVLLEKPMDVTLEACDRLIEVQQETGRVLAVVSQHRFDAGTKLAKAAVETGQLGTLVLADATVKWWRTQEYYDSGDWRGTWEWDGGGALMNQGVHTVDLLLWLAGEVTSLYGQVRTAAHRRIEVEDVAAAALTFANGALGTLTATTAAYPGLPVRIDLYGTLGSLILEGDCLRALHFTSGESHTSEATAAHALAVAQGGSAAVREDAGQRSPSAPGGAVWGDAHRAQIEDFLAAIQTGRRPLVDGREGRKPLEVILGVYRSARTGQPVRLREESSRAEAAGRME